MGKVFLNNDFNTADLYRLSRLASVDISDFEDTVRDIVHEELMNSKMEKMTNDTKEKESFNEDECEVEEEVLFESPEEEIRPMPKMVFSRTGDKGVVESLMKDKADNSSKKLKLSKTNEEITNDDVEKEAYRLIRIEVRRFDRETNSSELGNYVRGVVDLQTEIFKRIQSQYEN